MVKSISIIPKFGCCVCHKQKVGFFAHLFGLCHCGDCEREMWKKVIKHQEEEIKKLQKELKELQKENKDIGNNIKKLKSK